MGIFGNKNRKNDYMQNYWNSNEFTKDSMKMVGLVPSDGAREMYGWTEKDDVDSQEVLLLRLKEKLRSLISEGCTLRQEMELEIEIDGQINYINSRRGEKENVDLR